MGAYTLGVIGSLGLGRIKKNAGRQGAFNGPSATIANVSHVEKLADHKLHPLINIHHNYPEHKLYPDPDIAEDVPCSKDDQPD